MEVTYRVNASSILKEMGLDGVDAGKLTNAATRMATALIRSHLKIAARAKHTTARRLGATPTGFLGEAASNTRQTGEHTIVIPAPGMRRAYGPVVIRPNQKQALTIPKHPISYGKSVSDLKSAGWTVFKPKGKRVLLAKRDGQQIIAFSLAKKATLRHDPELMPPDQEITDAMKRGIAMVLQGL